MSTTAITEPKPIEITLGDGSIIKGATLEEAMQNAVKRVEDNVTAYKSEKNRREELALEVEQLRSQIAVQKQPAHDGKTFSKEKYYQVLNEDPIAAQNYMDQYRFGVPDPVSAFNHMREQVDSITQQSVAAAFTAQHAEDFPATPDAAKALRQRTEQLVASGFPFNVDTLNYAYTQIVTEGGIKPLERKADEADTPPPALRGPGGQLSDAEVSRAEQMSDADLQKLLRSKGMMV